MHRHGYKGRKLHRETDQRLALIKGLAEAIVINGQITTTHAKAKEVLPYLEKLITKAKAGGLHNRRQVISGLQTIQAANKLFDELAPLLNTRNSGYLSIKKSAMRKGDNSQMAIIQFVDDLKANDKVPVTETNETIKAEVKA